MSLNGYRGHFIDNVELHSRAEQAGLQHGDLVLEVNGTALLHLSHDNVVRLIKTLTNDPMQSRHYNLISYIHSKGFRIREAFAYLSILRNNSNYPIKSKLIF